MEDLSGVTEQHRVDIPWPDAPYLAEHRFLGKAVLPAVESMEILAAAVHSLRPDYDPRTLISVNCARFLPLDGGRRSCSADIEFLQNGSVRASLFSEIQSRSGGGSRRMEHVRSLYHDGTAAVEPVDLDIAAGLSGIPLVVEKERLYGEMVPFGPSFRNTEIVYITGEGAAAYVSSGIPAGDNRILGSPFTLDAALHCACAWGQSLFTFVGFPVAIDKRTVLMPTEPGKTYFVRVIPTGRGEDFFTARILIYGMDGQLHESVEGLTMKDISGGRLAPPAWISRPGVTDALSSFSSRCRAFTVLALDSIPGFAHLAFSRSEMSRYGNMAPKRQRSYAGSRLACKRLTRMLWANYAGTPPQEINTIADDGEKPAVQNIGGGTMNCTVSHDDLFVAAAAADRPVGIDVETVQERLVTTKRFYVKDKEIPLVTGFSLGEDKALVRIWTIKEAAAKALGATLAEAWRRTEVISIGEDASAAVIDGNEVMTFHITVENHCFTLVLL